MFIKKGGVVILTSVNIPESVSFSRLLTIFWQLIRWDEVHAAWMFGLHSWLMLKMKRLWATHQILETWSKWWCRRGECYHWFASKRGIIDGFFLDYDSSSITIIDDIAHLGTVSVSNILVLCFFLLIFPAFSRILTRTMVVNGLAGARSMVRRFHLNTTESSPLTTHGVNHVPSSSAHRKPLISVDTILEVRPKPLVVSEFYIRLVGGGLSDGYHSLDGRWADGCQSWSTSYGWPALHRAESHTVG